MSAAENLASDTGIPRIAVFRRSRSQTLADVLHGVGDSDAREVFDALVAELARHAQPQRSSMVSGHFLAIHGIGQGGLRVPGVWHVETVPRLIEWKEDHVLRLRADANEVQDIRKRNASPFGDEGPAFFAGLMGDVGL